MKFYKTLVFLVLICFNNILSSKLKVHSFDEKAQKIELNKILISKSEAIIKDLNSYLDKLFEEKIIAKNISHTKLSDSQKKAVYEVLLKNYKSLYPEYFEKLEKIQKAEEGGKSIFYTLKTILASYEEIPQEKRTKLNLNHLSAVSEDNFFSLFKNDKAINEVEKKSRKDRVKPSRKIQRIVDNKDVKIVSNKEFIDEYYLSSNIKQKMDTENIDFSVHPAFYPNEIIDQGFIGTCYASTAATLFSYAVNTLLLRKDKLPVKHKINQAQVAVCSSFKETFELTDSEKSDLDKVTYGLIVRRYRFNRINGGMFGPATVWIKHHIEKVFNSPVDQQTYWKLFDKGEYDNEKASNYCHNYSEENAKSVKSYQNEIKDIIEDIKKVEIVSAQDAFESIETIREALKTNGPMAFTIAISAKGGKALSSVNSIYPYISKEACNRWFNLIGSGFHAVVAVGVVKVKDTYYLKFKNSWGKYWGDNGYGYLEMDNDGSTCNYGFISRLKIGSAMIKTR